MKTKKMNLEDQVAVQELEIPQLVAEKPKAAKAEKTEKPKAEKKETKQSVARFADGIMLKGGTWEEMAAKINEYAEKTGQKQRYSKAQFAVHIKYRRVTQKMEDFLKGKKITDNGIE